MTEETRQEFLEYFLSSAAECLDGVPHVVDAKRDGQLGDGVHTQILLAAMHLSSLVNALTGVAQRVAAGEQPSATDVLMDVAPALSIAVSHIRIADVKSRTSIHTSPPQR